MTALGDEMPHHWVHALTLAIEAHGWTIRDAHETAIVINLDHTAHTVHDAGEQPFLVIGWDENGTHWGLSVDGIHVPVLDGLGGSEPTEVADRVHRVLRTGRPVPRTVRHALPYTAVSQVCVCPVVYPCGGIVPDADCVEHGARRTPVMEWHWEADCEQITS